MRGEDAGPGGARRARLSGSRLGAGLGSRSSRARWARVARRSPAGSPRLILGGVEQRKRRRRDRNRGGKKASCRLQNPEPRGAAARPSAGERRKEETLARGRAGTERPAAAHLFRPPQPRRPPRAGPDPGRPPPRSARRRGGSSPSAFSPPRPSPLCSTPFSAGAHTAPLPGRGGLPWAPHSYSGAPLPFTPPADCPSGLTPRGV